VQMPVMDGLSATRAIRTHMGPSLPIIAMTANAFSEDRTACLDAGMNDHVAKPVDPELLYGTLLRWLPSRERALLGEVPLSPAISAAPRPLNERLAAIAGFDLALGLRNVGGQLPLMTRVLNSFVSIYRTGEPALLEAPVAGELSPWRTACHSLRGACATVGASSLQQRLLAFEHALNEAAYTPDMMLQAGALQDELLALTASLEAELAV
jgi:two-component system, sensor histidine kinase and response regulator